MKKLALLLVLCLALPVALAEEEVVSAAVDTAVEAVEIELGGAAEAGEVLVAAPEWNEAEQPADMPKAITEFVVSEDGGAELIRYNGDGGDVAIPEGVATVYDSDIFANNLTGLSFPTTMTAIGDEVFQGQTHLKQVTFNSAVTTGEYAFARCTALESVVLPEGFETIGYCCFEDCGSLRWLKLPGTLKRISTGAFGGSGIAAIALPEGLEVIGEAAFAACPMGDIVIPASVKKVYGGAFESCRNLAEVTFMNPDTELGEGLFEVYDYEQGGFVPSCAGDLVIRGWPGSTAEAYADEWGYEFEPLATVAKVTLNKSGTQTLKLGRTLRLKATVKPAAAAADYPVTWSSSDTGVATVSRTGLVTPVAKGSVKITAAAGGKRRTIRINVVAPKPTAVALVKGGKKLARNQTFTLKKGRSVTLKTVLTPSYAETDFTWSSNRTRVATVSGTGKVRAVGKGTATITLATANGLKVRVKVKVG